ncbi:MAG TPA: CpaF family protein [Solirubrobacteraceae bacterium]|nr:CpaF family protein [Solirubrobacteraceae bacterium]
MQLHERLSHGTEPGDRPDRFAVPFSEIKNRIHMALIEDLGRQLFNTNLDEVTLRQRVHDELSERLAQEPGIAREDRERIALELTADIVGHGPLERLLEDDTVTEIMVNGPYDVWVERQGRLHRTPVRFTDEDHLRRIISKIVAQVGRRIDESSPMVDARLPDGSRINATIPPLSLSGPLLTIRKFGKQRLDMEALIKRGALLPETADLLERCVKARLNILIAGGTGSGKTTMLNALSAAIPDSERIITIEDAAELYLNQRHVLRLEARPKNIEGEGEVSIRDLVRNSLRMRPDRIVVGEVRGAEALDMLQAMNTGHDGSLSTLHANSPRDALARLETMVLMSGYDLPLRAVREQIASALDLLIQIERMSDGTRRVVAVTEVQRMESDVITLQDLYVFKVDAVAATNHIVGSLKPTGLRPGFLDKFERRGIEVPRDLAGGRPPGLMVAGGARG